jgi:hypothetical protein
LRRAAGIVTFTLAAVLTAGCGDSERPERAGSCERFCVTVSPLRGDTETVFRFRGRGWVPRREVTATYGVYCRPGRVCILIAKMTRFRTDPQGRFVFQFRNGPRRLTGVPRPRGHGGGPVAFHQRTGPPGSGEFVTRRPAYHVDGRPAGAPQQR